MEHDFDGLTEFSHNGVNYRLRFRKCTKPNCQCTTNPEYPGHGPYWYAGNAYEGKNLKNPNVLTAYNNALARRDEMASLMSKKQAQIEDLKADCNALWALSSGAYISEPERVAALGFSDCIAESE